MSYTKQQLKKKKQKKREIYIGITHNTFKTRYNLHLSSFRLIHRRKATSLSDHIWKIKERNNNFKITWKILTKAKQLQSGTGSCDLCTTEKLFIATKQHGSTLNIKSEILNKCVHKRAFYSSGKENTGNRRKGREASPKQ